MKEINCTIKLSDDEYEEMQKLINWLNNGGSNMGEEYWTDDKYIKNRFIAGLLEDVRLFLK